MTDIFQEVEEDVRREQYVRLWKRYGVYMIAAIVGLVGATAAFQIYHAFEARRDAEGARKFLAATDLASTDAKAAEAALAEIAKKGGGYGVLARFRAADAEAAAGNRAGALAQYDAIADDAGTDDLLRGLATLKSAYLRFDNTSSADLEARLAVINNAENPWRHHARELLAFAALKAGDRDGARARLASLVADASVPAGLKARSENMLAALGGPPPVKAAPAAPPAPPASVPSTAAPPAPAPNDKGTPAHAP